MRVQINATNFPDEGFRYYVSTLLDLGRDGYIDDDDIADATSMRIPYSGNLIGNDKLAHNLKGIEYFTELRSLTIVNQPVTSGLSFGALKKLESFEATLYGTGLSIDFRGCDALTSIVIHNGYSMYPPADDGYKPSTYQNVYLNTALKDFAFVSNSAGSLAFDFTNCTAIESVSINSTATSITGLSGKASIKTVDIVSAAPSLDFSNDSSLESVSAKGSSLKSLNCSNCVNLESVDCASSGVESVNCENCASLKSLLCGHCTSLSSLSITGCSSLERLSLSESAIRPSLDVREFKKLKALTVVNTNLSSLLLGEKPDLRELYCYTTSSNIYIRTLDLNGCDILRDAFVLKGTFSTQQLASVLRLQCDPRTVRAPVKITAFNGDDFVLRADQHSIYTDAYSSFAWSAWNRTTNEKVGSGSNNNSDYFYRSVATYSSKATSEKNGNLYYFEFRYPSSGTDSTTYISPDYLLSVVEPPVITSQPDSAVVAAGSTVSLSVTVDYEVPSDLAYQWQRLDSNGDWISAAGESNSSTYQFVCSEEDDGAQYRCKLSVENWYDYSDIAAITVVTTPNVTVHPASQVVVTGSTVAVSIAAEGGVLSFQWQVSTNGETWTPVDSAASSEYSFIASKSDSGKQYRCIVTNVAGSATSNPALLAVYDPPAIASRSVIPECIAENSEVSLSVTASGDDLHYRWEESANFGAWAPIDGATSSTYSFTALRADTGKRYRCYVYNDVGNVICDIYDDPANAENGPTFITVVYEPVVTPEESSSVVRTGNRASFSVSAEGGRLTYKWQVSSDNGSTWTDIPNATEDTYGFTSTKSDSGKQYRCQVTNIAGTTYSVAITLTVLDPPVINSELSIPDVGDGTEVRLQSDASGDELEYKWQISANGTDWADIAENGTGETYSFTASVSQNRTYYRYQVFNRVGEETSNAAQLFVITRPNITSQPESQVVVVQSQVSFSVGTEGEHLSHKWQVSSDNGSTWTDIPNATEDTYAFTATKSDSGKQYRCQVTNIAGTVESDPASLKVLYEPVIVTNPEFPNRVTAGDYVHCDADAHGDELQHQWYVKYAGIDQWYPIGAENGDVYTDSITYEHEPHQEDGEWIAGARFVRLAFYVTKEFFGNKYYCEFWNDVGRVSTPETNVLYVLSEPTIKSVNAPDSAVRTGNPVSLSVVADGGDLSYQWQISVDNGASWQNVVDGGKASTYSFTATVSQNGYQYQCIVTNVVGSATCAPISLKVQAAPSISAGPVSQSVGLDTTVTFTAAISGTDLVYQWQVSSDNGATWIDIGDTDASSYSLTAGIEKDGHMYRCRASNDLGFVVTGSALLTVLSFPEIITQPSSATVEYASNVVFLVAATGGELAYQWEYSFDNGATWTKITKNGTNTTYSFLAVDSQNGYLYHCIVGNKLGTVTSEAVSLTVLGSATTEEEIPVLVFAGKYLPSQMAAMIRELPIGANLDEIAFGARAVETLHASIGRTGSTDPRYYEEIAESINELKSLIAQLQSQNPSS